MNEELQEAIEKARKLEIDGTAYYTKLAQMCSVPSGKRMFESFADDERRHLRIIEDVTKGLGIDESCFAMPRETMRTLFSEAAERLDETPVVGTDEKEAVQAAMEMETKSFRLYEDAAGRAEDDDTQALFERLASEENQHYEMLENTLEYLNSNGQWFLWQEGALIVGDQSSLGLG